MSTILLVDHDLSVLGILSTLLMRQACVVALASSAGDALAVARQIRLDFVLTATKLPDASGEDLQKRFRRDPTLRQVRFFFMTGCPSDTADSSPAHTFVGPLPPDSLVNLLTVSPQLGHDLARLVALHRASRN